MLDLDSIDLDNLDFGKFSFYLASSSRTRPSIWPHLWNLLLSLFRLFVIRLIRTFVALLSILVSLCGSAGVLVLLFQKLILPVTEDIIRPLATIILEALPPAHAWSAFVAGLPLLPQHTFTSLAAAPVLWSVLLVLLGLGPHRLFAPPKPPPRHIRRLSAQAAFRASRRRNRIRHLLPSVTAAISPLVPPSYD